MDSFVAATPTQPSRGPIRQLKLPAGLGNRRRGGSYPYPPSSAWCRYSCLTTWALTIPQKLCKRIVALGLGWGGNGGGDQSKTPVSNGSVAVPSVGLGDWAWLQVYQVGEAGEGGEEGAGYPFRWRIGVSLFLPQQFHDNEGK